MKTKIIKFDIGEKIYKEMCPSGQCSIEYTQTSLNAPNPYANVWGIGYSIHFNLHDDNTNANLTDIQKIYAERFVFGNYCGVHNVEDILQEDDRVNYHCDSGFISQAKVERIHDSKSWRFEGKGVYDTKTENFKLIGNFMQ